MKIRFERQTCGRCMGSGQYPSAMWNGVCLKCRGKGEHLTKNGKFAERRYWTMINEVGSTSAEYIKEGDYILDKGVWIPVEEVNQAHPRAGFYTTVDGVRKFTPFDLELVMHRESQRMVWPVLKSSKIVRHPTKEEMAAIFEKVLKLKGATAC